jgi:hypothetical protein
MQSLPRAEANSWTTANKNWRLQSYHDKELDYANNQNEFRSRFFPGVSRLVPIPNDIDLSFVRHSEYRTQLKQLGLLSHRIVKRDCAIISYICCNLLCITQTLI